jgi:hypothetical protein
MDHARSHFLSFVDVRAPDECWPWKGGKLGGGYGSYSGPSTGRRTTSAHRAAYQLFVGPIAFASANGQRIHVDHTCHNRSIDCAGGPTCPHRICVNPEHLEAVPIRINNLRGKSKAAVNAVKDVCDNGHPYDEANTYNRRNGQRDCRKCKAGRMRATYRQEIASASSPPTPPPGTLVRIWGKTGRYRVTGLASDGRVELTETTDGRNKIIAPKYVVPLKLQS